MRAPALMLVGLLGASGCVQEAAQGGETVQSDEATNSALPTLPARGKITAADLVAVFEEACLKHFPDYDAALSAAERSQLRKVGPDPEYDMGTSGSFEDRKRGVLVQVFLLEATDIGPGGSSIYYPMCSVTAEVADPEANWSNLMSDLTVPGATIRWSKKNAESGSYRRDGKEMGVVVQRPYVADSSELPKGACGALPDCYAWTEASLSVSFQR